MTIPSELRELYPFTSRYADVGGHTMHYVDEGSGPPLVMLHGNPSWSFYYRRAIAEFSKDHRVIAPDHIGCGLSSKPDDAHYSYTLAQRVTDLETLIATIGLTKPFTLMVHDWGGMIGLAYAARHPEQIAGIIISNTAGFPLPPGRALPGTLKLARLKAVSPALVRGLNLFCRGAARFGMTRGRMPHLVRQGYLWPYRSWHDRRAIHRFIEDIPLSAKDPSYAIVRDVAAALPSFAHLPRLVLWGARDFVFDRHFLAQWRKHWPEASYHVIDDAGHYVLEDAWPECRAAVREFLSAGL